MKAICIKEFIKDKYKFEKGKEYEYDEIIVCVPGCPTSLPPRWECKGYAVKVDFFSQITGCAEKCISINFGDKNVARWYEVPCFYDYFEIKEQ